MWEGSDRRNSVRADFVTRIKITKKSNNEDVFSVTKNIGTGGICAVANKDLGVFSEVTVEIGMKDDAYDPVICSGRVAWVIKSPNKDKFGHDLYDIGIEFTNLTGKCLERVKKIIEEWRLKAESSG